MIFGASTVYKLAPAIGIVALALIVLVLMGLDRIRGRKLESPKRPRPIDQRRHPPA